jgi:hypothetical protein
MEINYGDKIIFQIKYGGKESNTVFYRNYLVISKNEFEGAKKLASEEDLEIYQIFGLEVNNGLMVEGSPLYDAVTKGELGTWVSSSIYKHVGSEDTDRINNYKIYNIIRKEPLFHERLMHKCDPAWINYSDSDDNKVQESLDSLDEQILLTAAGYISKQKYVYALILFHSINKEWSYKRIINIIFEIRKKRLTHTYGYFNESKT